MPDSAVTQRTEHFIGGAWVAPTQPHSVVVATNAADAIRIANDSPYGLAGGVWCSDENRATEAARRIRTGQVDINGGAFNPLAPFGGYKRSGMGREFGLAGVEEFTELKAIQR
jgi:aldehyde dehydrogenase (NAD+)